MMKLEAKAQEQRTFMRERFLRMLGCLSGNQAEVYMQEKTKVTCRFGATDVDFHHVHVADLSTPMGVIPQATLRTSDIIFIDLPNVDVLKKT